LGDVFAAGEDLQKALAGAEQVSVERAQEYGFTVSSKGNKGCVYIWVDDVIGKELCAVVREGVVLTILLFPEEMLNRQTSRKIRINEKTGRKYYV